MNLFHKFSVGAVALSMAAASASAAVNYPFPQNKKSPNGYTIPFATTSMIQDHFKLWKSAWYQDKGSEAWVLAPEGTCSTVSEAIAYGMLIMVYMSDAQNDYKTEFDKLYATWKSHNVSADGLGGMHWRIGCSEGSNSATDADVDAALALVMASKQWGESSYLDDAKKMIDWISKNDFNGTQLKPGNGWNEALNPSYATLGHFTLFGAVSGDKTGWETHRSDVAKDLLACQNASTGLVSDWCSWNDHKPTKTSASVAQSEAAGFFDDAARTPWRAAWAYYWYGDKDAKSFNEKISKWLIPTTMTASGVNSGYYVDGKPELSTERNFVSSTFSGGLGLATSSVESDEAKAYLATTYKALSTMVSCEKAEGCGTASITGEKYYPATLNLLYLLIMTGNMPNFFDMTGFTSFTPDPSLAPTISEISGEQMKHGDSTVNLSGFWNWGAYHDKWSNTGTLMNPDSGTSPLFKKNDGLLYAEASMSIGAEPAWGSEDADAGHYPSAGIAVSFKSESCKLNNTCGVDFSALGIKYVRVTMKSSGPIRIAVLNTKTAQAGGEPGAFVSPSSQYSAITYDLTPKGKGFVGSNGNALEILDWVDESTAPDGSEILKNISGFKWEVKDAKGGIGEFSIKAIELLDASKNVIDPEKVTGIQYADWDKNAKDSSVTVIDVPDTTTVLRHAMKPNSFQVSAMGKMLQLHGAEQGARFAVYSLQGNVIANGFVYGAEQNISVPAKGTYLVRVGSNTQKISVK